MRPGELIRNLGFASALALEGCSSTGGLPLISKDTNTAENSEVFKRDEFFRWVDQTIPANNKAVPILNLEYLQSEGLGLNKLYIANSADSPMVLIFCIWDALKVNIAANNTFYFQDYSESFTPINIPPETQFVDKSISQNMRQYFLTQVKNSNTIPQEVNNNIVPFNFGLRKRPSSENDTVLVLKLEGKPLIHIPVKLRFEKSLEITLPVIK